MVKALAAVICLLSPFSASAFAAGRQDVKLRIDRAGGLVVPVHVNGQGPFAFFLDTGANISSVSSDFASRLSLPVVAKTPLKTSTGSQLQLVVRLDGIAIGSADRIGLLASVIPSSQIRAAIGDVDGIVGQDFLAGFNYTLDYRRQR